VAFKFGERRIPITAEPAAGGNCFSGHWGLQEKQFARHSTSVLKHGSDVSSQQ
jgi:hypothetical protein